MANKIELIGIKGIPIINKGDNIPQILFDSFKENKITLEDGNILIVAQTIVSKALGQVVDLRKVDVSKRAQNINEKISIKAEKAGVPLKPDELIQKILDESKEIVKAEHVLIVETKHGFVCANAGIDKSNVEGEHNVALLPENPDNEAYKIRKNIKELTSKNIAVIISDSFGRPFRNGAVGVAIGVSGINSIIDKRGAQDLFGHELTSTIIGQIDNLASAAQLIMGETNEGIPCVLIKGYEFDFNENSSIISILRGKKFDLFRKGSEFIEILRNRRSYKLEFDETDLDYDFIKECIDLARWAPSAHNSQPWRYIILKRGEIREMLINQMNQKLQDDLTKDGKSKSFIERKIHRTRSRFLKAPFLIILCLNANRLNKYPDNDRNSFEFIMGIQSISTSATYLLLALESKGLAACWYCAPLFTQDIVKTFLNLPGSFVPAAFFTVGYSAMDVKPPSRKRLEDVIFKLDIDGL